MKPGRNSLWRISARVLFAIVIFGVVGNTADARAGNGSNKASTAVAATEVSISSNVIVKDHCLVVIEVAATDPNGPITSLTADLLDLPEGNDATFVTNATNTNGTIIWHPGPESSGGLIVFRATANGQVASTFESIVLRPEVQASGQFQWGPTLADVGTFTVTFIATSSGGETESVSKQLTVLSAPPTAPMSTQSLPRPSAQGPTRGPIISIGPCPDCGGGELDTVIVGRGGFLFTVTATDPEGGSIVSLTADLRGLPIGNTATFSADVAPTAHAGGPYTGVAGVPVELSAAGSSDPDGDALEYVWDFGDLMIGVGPAPLHKYVADGTYPVILVVRDPRGLSDCDATTATISGTLPARAFVAGGHRGMASSKPLCIQIEPVGGAYQNTQVDMSSIVMYSGVPGSTAHITALTGKTVVGEDRDGNGIQEITACFTREDLGSLFGITQGKQSVPAVIVANVIPAGTLRAQLDLTLVGSKSSLTGFVRPNPLHRTGTVSFETVNPGPVKVLLFDLKGRLVRTLLDQPRAASGHHKIPIDARDDRGRWLASGIYFYRVQAAEGVATGRLTILQ